MVSGNMNPNQISLTQLVFTPIIFIVEKRFIFLLSHIYPSLDYGKHFKNLVLFRISSNRITLGQ